MRQSVEREESPCRISARTATVSPWRITSWWVSRDTETLTTGRRGTARFMEANMNGERPTRILVVQLGAKVFRAHAVVQGLDEKLINALKLLANHQRDCDGPIQNIVTGL